MTMDAGESSILVLLDLSAAFTLQLLRSYLSDRTLFVVASNAASSSAYQTYAVAQGSIHGPLLFSISVLPLGHVIHKHNIQHCYLLTLLTLNEFNP